MQTQSLNGVWQFKETQATEWLPATVPGSAVGELYKQGLIEDPYWRCNEDVTTELGKRDFEFRRTFETDETLLARDRVLLVCEGLDTLADVTLNGVKLASTDNMHRTYEWDVKHLLRKEGNELHIVFRAPVTFITEQQAKRTLWNTKETVDGFPHLRKAHYMFGWDWGPVVPDAGIWKPISLVGIDTARLRDVYVTQRHGDGTVSLDVKLELDRTQGGDVQAEVTVTAPDGTKLNADVVSFSGAETAGRAALVVTEPRLWWPNGYGAQPLYTVEARLVKVGSGEQLDATTFRIGLRTLTVRREPDQWGESFEFVVNGVPIFAMGANYIPEDNILSRLSRERTERVIRDCVEANFNSIRVWGGAFYPFDWFYDLCDEYGLIVWQDFMFGCAVYEMTPSFAETVRREFEDNVRRIRHHASLGLWCGNNEMEWAWVDWNMTKEPKLRTDYLKLFEMLIPEVLAELDPNTFYWPASPSSGGSFDNPNDENRGDVHYWQVWHGQSKFTDYRQFYFRFCSEFGFQSFPELKTVESFTLPEDRNIFSYVMEKHQKSPSGNSKILAHIADNFLYPKDLDSLLYTSQLLQAEAIKYGVEHWRRHRGRCMGAIYWQLNDCWPVASWASIDYFGRWKALHYAAKRFFAPLLVSACEDGTKVSLHVTNDSLNRIGGKVVWKLRDPLSTVLEEGEADAQVGALQAVQAAELDFGDVLNTGEKRRNAYLEYALVVDDEPVSGGTVLFVKPKHFAFAAPSITAEIAEEEDSYKVTLVSGAFAKYVELGLTEADGHFSDNFFDLSAGEPKTVIVAKSRLSAPLTAAELSGRLRVRSLIDTYLQ
ncbi:glycoside hydrolase family 2 protein [Paenibacillus chartarius]|uniref:Beta-mannosidase B n=1 Tax=Paenibacillus chartarius TaxID=747481 RepID=A0ABV6DF19_9BACL